MQLYGTIILHEVAICQRHTKGYHIQISNKLHYGASVFSLNAVAFRCFCYIVLEIGKMNGGRCTDYTIVCSASSLYGRGRFYNIQSQFTFSVLCTYIWSQTEVISADGYAIIRINNIFDDIFRCGNINLLEGTRK